MGFRIEEAEKEPQIDDGVPVLRSGSTVTLRLFGTGFSDKSTIGLTSERLDFGKTCNQMISTGFFKLKLESSTNALVQIILPKSTVELFICATNDDKVSNKTI